MWWGHPAAAHGTPRNAWGHENQMLCIVLSGPGPAQANIAVISIENGDDTVPARSPSRLFAKLTAILSAEEVPSTPDRPDNARQARAGATDCIMSVFVCCC